MPKYEPINCIGDYRHKGRVFTRSVENVIRRYDGFYITNVDDIKPDIPELFDYTGYALSYKGKAKLWKGINAAVNRVDTGHMKLYKQVYTENKNNWGWQDRSRC